MVFILTVTMHAMKDKQNQKFHHVTEEHVYVAYVGAYQEMVFWASS